jgi:hypothetical protein
MTETAFRVSQSVERIPEIFLDTDFHDRNCCLRALQVDNDKSFLEASKLVLEMDGKFEVDTVAIYKRFVEAHDGIILVTSEEVKGTTFALKIPRNLRGRIEEMKNKGYSSKNSGD